MSDALLMDRDTVAAAATTDSRRVWSSTSAAPPHSPSADCQRPLARPAHHSLSLSQPPLLSLCPQLHPLQHRTAFSIPHNGRPVVASEPREESEQCTAERATSLRCMSRPSSSSTAASLDSLSSRPSHSAPSASRRPLLSNGTAPPLQPQLVLSWPALPPSSLLPPVPSLASLSFNVLDLDEDQLLVYAVQTLEHLNLVSSLSLSLPHLQRFLLSIRSQYRLNPYHNWHHGFHVFQFGYYMLTSSRLLAVLSPFDQLLCSSRASATTWTILAPPTASRWPSTAAWLACTTSWPCWRTTTRT